MIQRHIAINGELGSGKSSVARRLAETYGMRLVSTGDVQRAMAEVSPNDYSGDKFAGRERCDD